MVEWSEWLVTLCKQYKRKRQEQKRDIISPVSPNSYRSLEGFSRLKQQGFLNLGRRFRIKLIGI